MTEPESRFSIIDNDSLESIRLTSQYALNANEWSIIYNRRATIAKFIRARAEGIKCALGNMKLI